MKHLNIRISGRVQGVFFRASAAREALRLGLSGFVQNASDGTVYSEVEGEESAIDPFVAWCRHGPARARVEAVDIAEGPVEGFVDFHIAP